VLLAVIFSSETAPYSQTGHGAGIFQNISAVFSRISDILGVGTLHRKKVSDGDAVQVKEQVFVPVLWGIPGTLKTATPKTGLFPVFPLLQPI
jgi:hypothetical protein